MNLQDKFMILCTYFIFNEDMKKYQMFSVMQMDYPS
jgi:hypothetical protein